MLSETELFGIKSAIQSLANDKEIITLRVAQAKTHKSQNDFINGLACINAAEESLANLKRKQHDLFEKVRALSKSHGDDKNLDDCRNSLNSFGGELAEQDNIIFDLARDLNNTAAAEQSCSGDVSLEAKKKMLDVVALQQQWMIAPFRDMSTFMTTYNDSVDSQKRALEQIIKNTLIGKMTNLDTLKQGMILVGTGNVDIKKELLRQVIRRLRDVPEMADIPLFAMFQELLASSSHELEDQQIANLTKFIDKQIHAILSPDIVLSCHLIQSMTYAIQAILVSEDMQLIKEHQERILRSVNRIDGQLSALKNNLKSKERASILSAEDQQKILLLENIKLAIKEIKSALSHGNIPDQRTARQRYVDGLLQGCNLLIQAADVGLQWYGAVATFGVFSSGIIRATADLTVDLWKCGSSIYHYYHDDKEYFNALIQWKRQFEAFDEQHQRKYIRRLRKSTSTVDGEKYWHHPAFSEGVLQYLMAKYGAQPKLRPTILRILHNYFDQGRAYSKLSDPEQIRDAAQRLRQQISYYLLQIDLLDTEKQIPYCNEALRVKNKIRIDRMSADDKLLFTQQMNTRSMPIRNLAKEAWHDVYPGDVWLYEWLEKRFSLPDQPLSPRDLDVLGQINMLNPPDIYKKSAWGEAVMVLLKETCEKVEILEKGNSEITRRYLSFDGDLVVGSFTIPHEYMKLAATDPDIKKTLKELMSENFNNSLQHMGTAHLGKTRLDEVITTMRTYINHWLSVPVNEPTSFSGSARTIYGEVKLGEIGGSNDRNHQVMPGMPTPSSSGDYRLRLGT